MSQFYARYLPPVKPSLNVAKHSEISGKRKRTDQTSRAQDGSQVEQKIKKLKSSTAKVEANGLIENKTNNDHGSNKVKSASDGQSVLDKYRISEFAKTQTGHTNVEFRKGGPKSDHRSKRSSDKDDKRQDQEPSQTVVETNATRMSGNQKHTSILSKFDKAKNTEHIGPSSLQESMQDTGEVEKHGLEPIPQPEDVTAPIAAPTYSTIPKWQSNARIVDGSKRKLFKEMELSKELLLNLKKHNIQEAFPVQSTVIPLLLDRDPDVASDLCISAATGSGKTLAYTIPIIEALRASSKAGLRAVIVVPTRELVKQVAETCNICTSGTGLRVVTAVGSKSLKSEQAALIEEEQIYDPIGYKKWQDAPVNWTTFSLEKALENASKVSTENFLPVKRLKADILITTPGRLVDHLKSTDGFHLDDVEWLVVDEADRLLNESYQEWIEVVVPALQSRNATKDRDAILSHMRMELPPRVVRKILLSATMTQDISKLSQLGLVDPKLVVLRSSTIPTVMTPGKDEENSTGAAQNPSSSGIFNLPTTLHESAMVFKEGGDKPLVLYTLLKEQLGVESHEPSDSSSEDETTSSEDTSDEGSDSDTGSSVSSSLATGDDDSDDSDDNSTVSSAPASPSIQRGDFIRKKLETASSTHTKESKGPRALVFTKSTASAARLSRLLSLLAPSLATQISTLTRSTASSASSRQALSSFQRGRTSVLIATDRASRGIDIPGLEYVVNYDVPGNALTYVHRVGRTARAGKTGHCWTLVEHREGRWFWQEIGGKSDDCKIRRNTKMRRVDTKIEDESLRQRYEIALQSLGEEVKG